MRHKKGRQQWPATKDLDRSRSYARPGTLSTEIRRASVPANTTATAVGALALYLIGRALPPTEPRFGWALAERWLGQLVVERHFAEVAL